MKKQFYFLSPIEAFKVTSSNLEEVAEWCGGEVQETESRRVPGRMDKYVWVPTPKGTNISWAFPGMFVTKRIVVTIKGELRTTFAVFHRNYFEKNYFDTPKEACDATWERAALEAKQPKKSADVQVNVLVAEAMHEAIEKAKAEILEGSTEGAMEVLFDAAEKAVEEIKEEDLSEKLFDVPPAKQPAVTPMKLGNRVIRKVEDVADDLPEQPVLDPDTHDLDVREEDAITG